MPHYTRYLSRNKKNAQKLAWKYCLWSFKNIFMIVWYLESSIEILRLYLLKRKVVGDLKDCITKSHSAQCHSQQCAFSSVRIFNRAHFHQCHFQQCAFTLVMKCHWIRGPWKKSDQFSDVGSYRQSVPTPTPTPTRLFITSRLESVLN